MKTTVAITIVYAAIMFVPAARSAAGSRPYEMEWANRTTPDHPALTGFENVEGWTVETRNAAASLEPADERFVWGRRAAKCIYSGSADGGVITVRPPSPIPITRPFDCINFWIYGDNIPWGRDRGKPIARVGVILAGRNGKTLEVPFLRRLDWPGWYVLHVRLNQHQLGRAGPSPRFIGIRIRNARRTAPRTLYFDNLSVYRETFPPLTFRPQPKPGVDFFEGQDCGIYTGRGRLSFPTDTRTILPGDPGREYTATVQRSGGGWIFRCRDEDGVLAYRYRPETGTLGDVTAVPGGKGTEAFRPLAGGGVRFAPERFAPGALNPGGVFIPRKAGSPLVPEKIENIDCVQRGDTVVSRWRMSAGRRRAVVTYRFRLWRRSLVVDVQCTGGQIGAFVLGGTEGLDNAALVSVPYLTGENAGPCRGRPAVIAARGDGPVFITAFLDHYRSNASRLFFVNKTGTRVVCNGGSRYLPRTDGVRNDCYERLFLTVSPHFADVLPNVPNPASPWRKTAAGYLVTHHGARDREKDYRHWREVARYGMTDIVVLDHEVGWRDEYESFTFRTRPAPGKGGDEGQARYARRLSELGFRYGLYNNYTDFAPVNEFWNGDRVGRTPDNQWLTAWPRCYSPRPLFAAEYEEKLTPVIQKKFELTAGYCDVHTAITPWRRVDYDARIPGAGRMIGQFYAYGRILLHQQRVWNGPVYSEGGNHWWYAGLVTGNKSDDRGCNLALDPWLVDFDLRKLHPLSCDVGFGKFNHFMDDVEKVDRQEVVDRFLAGTVAFGHAGEFFNHPRRVTPRAVHGYYMLRALQARYGRSTVVAIRYAGPGGRLLDTDRAVTTGAYKRSQVRVRYENGLTVWVNGNRKDTWPIPGGVLPPNGFAAKSASGDLSVFSGLRDGRRADYVDAPAYTYVNGRGTTAVFPAAAADGVLVILKKDGGRRELIPVGRCRTIAVKKPAGPVTVTALDREGSSAGPVTTETRDGYLYLWSRNGVFSYRVAGG